MASYMDQQPPYADEVPVEGSYEVPKAGRASRKREPTVLRKAPGAPKRFKSSYICFFSAKQAEIKQGLGEKATVGEVSKRSAELWRQLPAEERSHWDDVAAKDKQRYLTEKANYNGPWQVPWKRSKKDPSAPKRPMSAFLFFSRDKRRKIKEENPTIKNTEVSKILGEMWRNASEEERKPAIDKEKEEREKYKIAMAEWRVENEKKLEAQRKQQAERAAQMQNMYDGGSEQQEASDRPQPAYAMAPPFDPAAAPPGGYGGYPGYGYGAYPPMYSSYPPNANPYGSVSGKYVAVLGPNGMPSYVPPPPPPPPSYGEAIGQVPTEQQSYDAEGSPTTPAPYDYGLPNEEQGEEEENDETI